MKTSFLKQISVLKYDNSRIAVFKESEDKVEFKAATLNFSYAGSEHRDQERRRCFLGYVIGFANEAGGMLVLGMADKAPHDVVGSDFAQGKVGALEDETYSRLGIRVRMEELYENGLRVLIAHIPSRPVGKMMKFEGVPLMRVGESLRNMSDEEMFAILSEQEPDFSEKICADTTVDDLDEIAINKLKEAYSEKQNNPRFLTLSNFQALSDLGLIKGNNVTYAVLVLVGKELIIKSKLPQSAINLEYRNSSSQIFFDNKEIFSQPYFVAVDILWSAINSRNGKIPVQQGAFIFDIPYFNKEVIREAINNAVAHRDYSKSGEIVIKQYPSELIITNPGGFPLGVNVDNLITVNSTPRNRLLADVLAKTGIVERSGQGVDKIFYQTISEAKPSPNYAYSDNYQVELRLSGVVEDKAFALFIRRIQQDRKNREKLSVHEVIALNEIRKGLEKKSIDVAMLKKLEKEELIERIGKTNSQKVILSKLYFEFTDNRAAYTDGKPIDGYQVGIVIMNHIQEFGKGKMKDFEFLLRNFMSRGQVKYVISKMVADGLLDKKGKGKGTEYFAGSKMSEGLQVFQRAMELGFKEMQRLGELKSSNSPEIRQKNSPEADI
jgi:ATP-dependent DNA helicase RecG